MWTENLPQNSIPASPTDASRRRRLPHAALAAALAALAAGSAGCQAGYVLEQGYRQLTLTSRQVPIESVELRATLSPAEQANLRWVPEILRFSREELGLDPGSSYQSMLDTDGKPVSWVVTAAHSTALIPYRWRFPFVGTVSYKGFFDREDAVAEAGRLERRGYEVELWPVAAFSTLGWFRDPVLATMLEGSVADLASILIHETTHRTLYFTDDTSFNESLATHVAREGTVRFIFAHPELRPLLRPYLDEQRRRLEHERLLFRLKDDLEALYRSALPPDAIAARKQEIFATSRAAYRVLDPDLPSSVLPDSNAYVLSVSRYHEHERLLLALQDALGGQPADLVAYLERLPRGGQPVAYLTRELAIANR